MSSRVSAPPQNIDFTPFYLGPPKKSKSARTPTPFMRNSPQNFGEIDSPLEMYSRPKKDLFFKETKDFISNNEK